MLFSPFMNKQLTIAIMTRTRLPKYRKGNSAENSLLIKDREVFVLNF